MCARRPGSEDGGRQGLAAKAEGSCVFEVSAGKLAAARGGRGAGWGGPGWLFAGISISQRVSGRLRCSQTPIFCSPRICGWDLHWNLCSSGLCRSQCRKDNPRLYQLAEEGTRLEENSLDNSALQKHLSSP